MNPEDYAKVDLIDVLPLLQGEIDTNKCPRKTLEFVGSYLDQQEKVTDPDLLYLRSSSIFNRLINAVEIELPGGLPKTRIGDLRPILNGNFSQEMVNFWAVEDKISDGKYSRPLGMMTSNDGVSMRSLPCNGPEALRQLIRDNRELSVPKLRTVIE